MKKYFLFIAAILILGSSCKKDFLSVNETNPNKAASVPGNLILPAALNLTASTLNNPKRWDFIYLWYGIWSISGGYTLPTDLSQYNVQNSAYQGNWDNLYLAAKSFDDIEKASTTPQASISLGIAKIMKAYIFQNLVDIYGNVPYTDAFKGASSLKPKYDKQQAIYEDLIVQIDAGIAAINGAPVDVYVPASKEDIMFAGNKSKWIKFANTLKLRILIHQAGMAGRETYIKPLIAKITGGFIGADEGAMVNPGYLQNAEQMNPTWAAFYTATNSLVDGGFNYYKANQDAINFTMNNRAGEDWRAFILYQGYNTSFALKGNYFGVGAQLSPSASSSIGSGNLQSFNQSSIILSDFESLFLQAEAAQRGWIGTVADAKIYYYAALKANYKYLGIGMNSNGVGNPDFVSIAKAWGFPLSAKTSPYDDFIASNVGDPAVDFDAATDKIKCIISQKWIALSGNTAVEIWTDYRRTGFPSEITWSGDAAKKNPTPPVRLLYPQTELNTNTDNVSAQGAINLFTSKIFWQNR